VSESSRLLLTYKQAGELLQVSDRTVFTLVKTGRLRAVRFGPVKRRRVRRNGREMEVEHAGTVRIDRRDLEDFIQRAKDGQGVARAD
jgi:excisionase family DNA binding protein